jgi:hypothetical protein
MAYRTEITGSDIEKQALLESFIHPLRFDGNPFQCTQFFSEPTTTRMAGGLDFTAKGGKKQGHAVPQSLKTVRCNRVRSTGLVNPIAKGFLAD